MNLEEIGCLTPLSPGLLKELPQTNRRKINIDLRQILKGEQTPERSNKQRIQPPKIASIEDTTSRFCRQLVIWIFEESPFAPHL
jgi:hypothetical protein